MPFRDLLLLSPQLQRSNEIQDQLLAFFKAIGIVEAEVCVQVDISVRRMLTLLVHPSYSWTPSGPILLTLLITEVITEMNHQVQKMLETCGCCSFSQWEPEDHGRAMPRNWERRQPASLRNHREVPCAIDRGWKGCVGEYKITSKGHNVFACRQMDSICFAKISNRGHRNDTWLLPPTHQPKSNERKRKKDSSPKSTQIVPNSINQINPKKIVLFGGTCWCSLAAVTLS